jgi:hypothetical protein
MKILLKIFFIFLLSANLYSDYIEDYPLTKIINYDAKDVNDINNSKDLNNNFLALGTTPDSYVKAISIDCTWGHIGSKIYWEDKDENQKNINKFSYDFRDTNFTYSEKINFCKDRIIEIEDCILSGNVYKLSLNWTKAYIIDGICTNEKIYSDNVSNIENISETIEKRFNDEASYNEIVLDQYSRKLEENVDLDLDETASENSNLNEVMFSKVEEDLLKDMIACNMVISDHKRHKEVFLVEDILSNMGAKPYKIAEIGIENINVNKFEKRMDESLSEDEEDFLDTVEHQTILDGSLYYLILMNQKYNILNEEKPLEEYLINFYKKTGFFAYTSKYINLAKVSADKFRKLYKDERYKPFMEYINPKKMNKYITRINEAIAISKQICNVTHSVAYEIKKDEIMITQNGLSSTSYYQAIQDETISNQNSLKVKVDYDIKKINEIYGNIISTEPTEPIDGLKLKAIQLYSAAIGEALISNPLADAFKTNAVRSHLAFPVSEETIVERCIAISSPVGIHPNILTKDILDKAFYELINDIKNNFKDIIDSRSKRTRKNLKRKIQTSPVVVAESLSTHKALKNKNMVPYVCKLIRKTQNTNRALDLTENVILGVGAVVGLASIVISFGSSIPLVAAIGTGIGAAIDIGFGILATGIISMKVTRHLNLVSVNEKYMLSHKIAPFWPIEDFLAKLNKIRAMNQASKKDMWQTIILESMFAIGVLAKPIRALKLKPALLFGKNSKIFKACKLQKLKIEKTFKTFKKGSKSKRYIKPTEEIMAGLSKTQRSIFKPYDFLMQMTKCPTRAKSIWTKGQKISRTFSYAAPKALIAKPIARIIAFSNNAPEGVNVRSFKEILKDSIRNKHINKEEWETIWHHTKVDIIVDGIFDLIKLGTVSNGNFLQTPKQQFFFLAGYGWVKSGINNAANIKGKTIRETYVYGKSNYVKSRITADFTYQALNALVTVGIVNFALGYSCLFPGAVAFFTRLGVAIGHSAGEMAIQYNLRERNLNEMYFDEGFFIVDKKVTDAIDEIIKNADEMNKEKLDKIIENVKNYKNINPIFDISNEEENYPFSWNDDFGDLSSIN